MLIKYYDLTKCYYQTAFTGQPPHLATVANPPSSPNPIRGGHAFKSGGSFFQKTSMRSLLNIKIYTYIYIYTEIWLIFSI